MITVTLTEQEAQEFIEKLSGASSTLKVIQIQGRYNHLIADDEVEAVEAIRLKILMGKAFTNTQTYEYHRPSIDVCTVCGNKAMKAGDKYLCRLCWNNWEDNK
jgi:hypothetical protein